MISNLEGCKSPAASISSPIQASSKTFESRRRMQRSTDRKGRTRSHTFQPPSFGLPNLFHLLILLLLREIFFSKIYWWKVISMTRIRFYSRLRAQNRILETYSVGGGGEERKTEKKGVEIRSPLNSPLEFDPAKAEGWMGAGGGEYISLESSR